MFSRRKDAGEWTRSSFPMLKTDSSVPTKTTSQPITGGATTSRLGRVPARGCTAHSGPLNEFLRRLVLGCRWQRTSNHAAPILQCWSSQEKPSCVCSGLACLVNGRWRCLARSSTNPEANRVLLLVPASQPFEAGISQNSS